MALPRPPSIFDTTLTVRTGMQSGDAANELVGWPPGTDPFQEYVLEASDAAFDAWLQDQKPIPDREKWFLNKMQQLWMKTMAEATKAQVAYTAKLWDVQRHERPGPPLPCYRPAHCEPDLATLQAEWDAAKAEEDALRDKALRLAERADKIRPFIDLVVALHRD